MLFGIDFHEVYLALTQTLGPLCVLFAPTLAIERALAKICTENSTETNEI